MSAQNLLVELFVEELPPKALKKLGEAFAQGLFDQLKVRELTTPDSRLSSFASPRRLAAHITAVATQAADKPDTKKLMPKSVAFGADGKPTPALIKKAEAISPRCALLVNKWPVADGGSDRLFLEGDGKSEALFFSTVLPGADVRAGLQRALESAIDELPIPKVMTYQLADGWSDVKFVRPAHSLIALHGADIVPVEALGLKAGRTTRGHRFEAAQPVVSVEHADRYAAVLERDGAVIASFEARRAEIVRQLDEAAARVGGGARPIEDQALLDEVTALVERPNVVICQFEKEFLEVPQECLILTMKANQKYFPLLDAQGKLTNRFLVVSNIRPEDPSAVIQGNERVVRPRLADAKFFFDQDRKKTLASRVDGLAKVVYHNKLGSQAERMQRVRAISSMLANAIDPTLVASVEQTAELSKTDLLTDMVGEFPELQGTIGRYYALSEGLSSEVADAIEDHYRPRFSGDDLPRNRVGLIVALADKLETLVGMFGIGNLPTGERDPFALRRHALGVIRILLEKNLPVDLDSMLRSVLGASDQLGFAVASSNVLWVKQEKGSVDVIPLAPDTAQKVADFIYDRLAGLLREQGYSAQEVDAVLALRPQRLGDVSKRLAAVRAFAALPEAPALAAANKRIGNILKKADKADAHVSEVLLREPAEQALFAAMKDVAPRAAAQFEAGDYTASLQTLAALRSSVDSFFDGVMVNAEEADLRLNRLGLLATLHQAMNRVADLSRLVQ